jgi:hypothetical protein
MTKTASAIAVSRTIESSWANHNFRNVADDGSIQASFRLIAGGDIFPVISMGSALFLDELEQAKAPADMLKTGAPFTSSVTTGMPIWPLSLTL